MRTLGLLLWDLLRPVLALILVLDTTVLGLLTIGLAMLGVHQDRLHAIGRAWSRLNLWLSGVRVQVQGLEQLPAGLPLVVMANHQSLFDVWALLGHLPLQLRFVMKAELRRIPIFGPGCARMGHLYVARGGGERARQSLDAAGRQVRGGTSVLFFPEGTRSPDGHLLEFKKGGFHVAQAAGVPILPLTVTGGREVLPRGSLRQRPGRMRILVHPPVQVARGDDRAAREVLVQRVRAAIQQGLDRACADAPSPGLGSSPPMPAEG